MGRGCVKLKSKLRRERGVGVGKQTNRTKSWPGSRGKEHAKALRLGPTEKQP